MEKLLEYFSRVDFANVRTRHPPELIFLCGGSIESGNNFRPKVQEHLLKNKRNVALAEKVFEKWEHAQHIPKDLLELERYYAALVSVIPIICESFGSAAELGAFVSDESIKNKLFIIISRKYYDGLGSSSFIRNGIIKNFEEYMSRNRRERHQVFVIDDENPEDELESLCNEIVTCEPKTSKCNFSLGYSRILLLIEVINILLIDEEKAIFAAYWAILKLASYNNEQIEKEARSIKSQFDEMIFILGLLNKIKIIHKGTKKYIVALEAQSYLQFSLNGEHEYNITDLKRHYKANLYQESKGIKSAKRNVFAEVKSEVAWFETAQGMGKPDAKDILRTAPLQYKTFTIRKRSGGLREISQPTPKLKLLQRAEYEKLISRLPIHECATAYRRGKSGILINAERHKNSAYFYKLDFKDFFPSIKAFDFNELLEAHNFSLEERTKLLLTFFRFDKGKNKYETRKIYNELKFLPEDYLINPNTIDILTSKYKNLFQLSIGAPSSPFVSNVLMYDFDVEISNWAFQKGIKYTRYADDLTFSSDKKSSLVTISNKIRKILSSLRYPKILLNDKKSVSISHKNRVTITGLNVTHDGNVSLGRDKKKMISSMVHRLVNEKLSVEEKRRLWGWLSYIKDVERPFYERLEVRYGSEMINGALMAESIENIL